MNPSQMFNIIQQYRAISANPQEISKVLLNSGKITRGQYDAIKDIKSPAQIGNYLMNNGILGQQQVNQMSQMIPQIQGMMSR